jgi:hypothetical protein
VWIVGSILILCLPQQPNPVMGREVISVNPYRVEAAFLRNFAHYVSWPHHAFTEDGSPWNIGILGPDPFQGFIENTLKGRTEQGRTFAIFRANRLKELPPCQIIFFAFRDTAQHRAILEELKDKPVLTVGEAPNFLKEGGIIEFQVGNRVSMSVNLDQARDVSLNIPTKMLEVSEWILEDGVFRKMR